jgi:hypothetical protein
MKEFDKIFSIGNFADNPGNYSKLKSFWKDVVKEVIGNERDGYVNNFYANGKEILDGNPIYTALLRNEKGIRIIQLEVDPDEPMFVSWTNKVTIHDHEIEELVISLQLTFETYLEAKGLIYLFSNNALTSSILLGINEKYDVKWNLGKLTSTPH